MQSATGSGSLDTGGFEAAGSVGLPFGDDVRIEPSVAPGPEPCAWPDWQDRDSDEPSESGKVTQELDRAATAPQDAVTESIDITDTFDESSGGGISRIPTAVQGAPTAASDTGSTSLPPGQAEPAISRAPTSRQEAVRELSAVGEDSGGFQGAIQDTIVTTAPADIDTTDVYFPAKKKAETQSLPSWLAPAAAAIVVLILIPVTFWLVSTAGDDGAPVSVPTAPPPTEPIPPLPRPLPVTPLPVATRDASPPPSAAFIEDAGPPPVAPVEDPPPTEPAKTDAAPPPPEEPGPAKPPTTAGPTKRRPRSKGTGELVLRIRPYADVHIDGRRRGLTPMPPISLPAGRHRVRLVNDTLGRSVIRNVVIEPGKRTILSVNLNR